MARPGIFKPFYDHGTESRLRRAGPRRPGSRAVLRCGLALLRSRTRSRLLRHRQPGTVQRRAARRATTSGPRACWRAGRAMARWCGPTSSRRTTTGTTTPTPRTILADLVIDGDRRARSSVHFDKNGFAYTLDRATGRGAGRGTVCRRELGRESDRSRDRSSGAERRQANGRIAGHGARASARALRAARALPRRRHTRRGRALLRSSTQQPVHGLGGAPRRHRIRAALPSCGANVPYHRRAGWESRRVHCLGRVDREERCGRSRKRFRSGAARSRLRAMSPSMARSMAGSRPRTPRTGKPLWKVQGRLGRGWRPDHLPRARRQAVRGGLRGHRRRLVR